MVTPCLIGLIKKTDYTESMGLQDETNASPTAVVGWSFPEKISMSFKQMTCQ
jgi:hypothetical protein